MGGKEPLFVDLKGFILRASQLEKLGDGQAGLNSFQREMAQISKLDTFEVKPAKIRDHNPLNSIELQVELIYKNESVEIDNIGAIKVHENDIAAAIQILFNGRYINKGEMFLI